jgi:hypothetical protein
VEGVVIGSPATIGSTSNDGSAALDPGGQPVAAAAAEITRRETRRGIRIRDGW